MNEPFSSSAAEARLKTYLKEMGSVNGETLRGFRSGCAITLAFSGIELSEVMDRMWVGLSDIRLCTTYNWLKFSTKQGRQLA